VYEIFWSKNLEALNVLGMCGAEIYNEYDAIEDKSLIEK